MDYLILITIVVFVMYISRMAFLFSVPNSISDTYYLLEDRKEGSGWQFIAFCTLLGLSSMILFIDAFSGKWYQFLGFFAGSALCFVGASPKFKEKLEVDIHVPAALTCAILSLLCCILLGYALCVIVCFALAAGAYFISRRQDLTYWLEMACFVSTLTSLAIYFI
jgi:hypothetical protein